MTENEIDLDNPEFLNAWRLISYTRQSVFLTGKAGTGKSTFLKYICANTTKKHVILAPTGIAAVNVGGVTLHSFFRIPFKPLLPDDEEFSKRRLKSRMKYSKQFQKLLKELDLIVIDEISMVRADIIDFIDKILRTYSDNQREPFGGKQMLFIGDVFQLEPVVTGDMRDVLARYYSYPYFFNAFAFARTNMVSIELRKVYRQSDSTFIGLLDRVRVGRPTSSDVKLLNSKVTDCTSFRDNEMRITLATTRDTVDSINEARLDELPAVPVTYYGEIKGDFPESSLPTSMELTIKEGAQVVFIKNDTDKRWVNGTIGRVCAADEDSFMVELDNGERHLVEPVIWDNIRYDYDDKNHKVKEIVLGSFMQFPVRLAWALTIHKSQGLTFNNVIIDMGHGAFSGGQAYVALSRCRSLDGMSLRSTINERDIFINPAIVNFSKGFNDLSSINDALEKAKADALYNDALEAVRRGDVSGAWDNFVQAMRCRNEIDNELMMRFVRMKLSEVMSLQKEIDRLELTVAENQEKFRSLAGEYVALGNELLKEGMEPTPILANFNKALSICPECTEALIGKARAYEAVGETGDAIDCYRKAYEIDNSLFRAAYSLGKLYLSLEEYAHSLNWLLVALDLNDENPFLHDRLSELYDKIDDNESSDRHASIAKKLRASRKGKKK